VNRLKQCAFFVRAATIRGGNLNAEKKTPPPVKKPLNLVWPLPPKAQGQISGLLGEQHGRGAAEAKVKRILIYEGITIYANITKDFTRGPGAGILRWSASTKRERDSCLRAIVWHVLHDLPHRFSQAE
jgi:hypothetical protein